MAVADERLLVQLVLFWVVPMVVTTLVARSRRRSLAYILWPRFLSWFGAVIAVVVVLVQAEKRPT